jgi:hypothetical protein
VYGRDVSLDKNHYNRTHTISNSVIVFLSVLSASVPLGAGDLGRRLVSLSGCGVGAVVGLLGP